MVELVSVASVNSPFKYRVSAAEGTGNGTLKWRFATLPEWLSATQDGELTGTPTKPGDYEITVSVVDGAKLTATAELRIKVLPPIVEVDDSALFSGTVGRKYDGRLSAKPGTGAPPIYWRAFKLPLGLSLDRFTGRFSGIPTFSGDHPLHILVEDSAGRIVDFTKTILVKDRPPQITSPAELKILSDAPASIQLKAIDGGGGLTWASDGLPDGLALNPKTGELFGTPTARGSHLINIKVTDQFLYSDEKDIVLVIQ